MCDEARNIVPVVAFYENDKILKRLFPHPCSTGKKALPVSSNQISFLLKFLTPALIKGIYARPTGALELLLYQERMLQLLFLTASCSCHMIFSVIAGSRAIKNHKLRQVREEAAVVTLFMCMGVPGYPFFEGGHSGKIPHLALPFRPLIAGSCCVVSCSRS